MKPTKIISLCIISLVALTNLNADRVKKDLVASKENEIITLLEEKTALLDKLIIEAKIYKKDTDPLIQKNFYNTPSVFVTWFGKGTRDISTHTRKDKEPEPTPKIETKSKYLSKLGSNKISFMPSINFNNSNLTRDIFGIPMIRKDISDVFFHSNINYVPILDRANKNNVNYSYQDKVDKIITIAYEERLKSSITKVLNKYTEVISILDSDNTDRTNNFLKKVKPFSHQTGWAISSRIFLFEFNLDNDETFKKRVYQSSMLLDETFKKLQAREDISLTTPSKYYDEKIDKNLRCLQTAKPIKYKGKICINSINVEQEKFFKYGTFETKETNFIYQNKNIFESLNKLDIKLKKTTHKYIEYVLSKIKDMEATEVYEKNKEKSIDIKGGL